MFEEKIKDLESAIACYNDEIATKTADVKNLLEADDLEGAKAVKEEITNAKENLATAKADLELFKSAENTGGAEGVEGEKVQMEEMTYLEKAVAYLRSKGKVVNEGLRFGETSDEILVPLNDITPTTDGVKKTETTPITSEEISYVPKRELQTVVDLKRYTTIHKATKASGKYPILKRATTKMVSVAELEKNPALAKPEFDSLSWEVATYRGAIPVSQESIDDADVDLMGIVAENAEQIKLNTTNHAIAEVFKTFTAKEATSLDDLKAIQNVDLDPAYTISLVVSQSFYHALDTVKDKEGRYMLQDSIISPSGKVFAGHPVYVVSDDVFGEKGDAKAFVGDISRAVLYVDRKELGLRWADNEIYGQYLQAVVRFGVTKADAKAGYFVTYTTPSEA